MGRAYAPASLRYRPTVSASLVFPGPRGGRRGLFVITLFDLFSLEPVKAPAYLPPPEAIRAATSATRLPWKRAAASAVSSGLRAPLFEVNDVP